ncbi:Trp biosynthesis-associated membrane protein [Cellulomonas sp. URHE0023]|uniref:Trp biosynthesis-associated membrane protein n=1 Tax=Cellulomonas sp. URHE0023 TaxID=1380354 RepID=UPI00068E863C|nr:Trp biosynthesis-associated membrane protein [Cellulomonas sp. URHE0023]
MSDPARARAGRGRAAGVLVVLAGLTALTAVPVWFTTSGTTALEGTVQIAVRGTDVAPAILAAAVAILAAGAATGLVGRAGRWVVALVVAACGGLVVATAASALADPAAAVASEVATQTGVGHLAGPVTATPWPTIALVVGVVDLVAAVWLVVASRRWNVPTRRYQATPDPAALATAPDERADWDALSRGDDPS